MEGHSFYLVHKISSGWLVIFKDQTRLILVFSKLNTVNSSVYKYIYFTFFIKWSKINLLFSLYFIPGKMWKIKTSACVCINCYTISFFSRLSLGNHWLVCQGQICDKKTIIVKLMKPFFKTVFMQLYKIKLVFSWKWYPIW